MRIAITGSVATDHRMTFPASISAQLIAGKLDRVSLSFLVDTLDIRDGGVGANIAYGLARLGLRPLLVAAAGTDFTPYGNRLAGWGVDLSGVQVSETRHTARCLTTTDPYGSQITSFYPGAMIEAANLDLAEIVRRHGGADLVLVGADDPAAMLRHTEACRTNGLRFAADPSQQLATLDGTDIRRLVAGADHLFTNEYERALLLDKTGWTAEQTLERVGTWVITLGDKGSRVERAGEPAVEVPAVTVADPVDPTGVGDAFRAGYLAAWAAGGAVTQRARAGSVVASLSLAAVGSQTYDVARGLVPELLIRPEGGFEGPASGLLPAA